MIIQTLDKFMSFWTGGPYIVINHTKNHTKKILKMLSKTTGH